ASAVGFAEAVTPGNQRDRLFVVHRHTAERFANILGRREGIRLAVRPFRIDVDQTHLHGGERILKITVAGVALVSQPLALGAPVEVPFGLPDILAPTAET